MDEKSGRTADLDVAYEAGRQAGLDAPDMQARCPFTREALDLRIAWLDGFAAGKWEATRGRSSSRLRSPFFGSGITSVSRGHRL